MTTLALPGLARRGLTGQLNYAIGRVYFYNPVTGGFVTEAEHLTDTNRFVAPMDQTHTLTGAMTWRHSRTGLWLGAAIEYGSGTPIGHGAAHDHGDFSGSWNRSRQPRAARGRQGTSSRSRHQGRSPGLSRGRGAAQCRRGRHLAPEIGRGVRVSDTVRFF